MNGKYQNFIYNRNNNIMFSLHDSRVSHIKFHNKILTLKVDKLFQYVDHEEKSYSGEVRFHDCDLDLCSVLIFNKALGKGNFNGKAISMQEFMDRYENIEFEIITEGYFGNNTTYTGWIWSKGKSPVSCIMYIWNSGDMVYCIDDKDKI